MNNVFSYVFALALFGLMLFGDPPHQDFVNLCFDPFVAPALIGAGASLIGSIFGGSSSARAQEKTNQANIAMNRENNAFNANQALLQRQWQEDMWNKQNEYNLPKNQVARALEAGINPYIQEGSAGNIISGSAAASPGSGSSASASGAPNLVAPDMSYIGSGVSSAIQSGLSVLSGMTQATESNVRQLDTLKKMGYYEKDYKLRKSASDIQEQMLELSREQMGYQNELLRWQSAESASKITSEMYQRDLIKANIRLTDKQTQSLQNELDHYAEMLRLRWYDSKTGRINAAAAMKQALTMANRLAFDEKQWKNFGIPEISPDERYALSRANAGYLIASLTHDKNDADWSDNALSHFLSGYIRPITETAGSVLGGAKTLFFKKP